MKIRFFLFLLICPFVPAIAQPLLHCGADEMRIATLQKDPAIANAVIRNDQQLELYTKKFVEDFYQHRTPTPVYTIPVVFHVIHNYGTENISDAQILDGLDILNKTFRKQLADTASIVPDFKPLHADCEIEFKLAQLDPSGNCTGGITRTASPLTTIGDHSVKSLIQWPPSSYLNIYIVSNAAGLAGHCVWPADADSIPAWDGIVIGSTYVGSIGTSNYTRSVALAHEAGHYLNLQHIWGGNNVPGFYYYPCADTAKDCSIDDLVADTPPTIGWESCNLSGASCGNVVDNVQNTMDYSYCNRMFTYGQKARMQACLNDTMAQRNNLWTPANLLATGVNNTPILCHADFNADKTVVCQTAGSNQISFSNASYNGPFTAYYWQFPGGSPATSTAANPLVSYTTPGKYDVTLKVFTASDSLSITKTNYISVLPATGTPPPYSEGFESLSNLDGPDWLSNSMDEYGGWQVTDTAAFSGTHSVMVPAFNLPINGKDELYSKVINLSGSGPMNISFNYAFARTPTSAGDDKLQLFIANSCNTGWVQRLNITGTALETAAPTNSYFVPSGSTEWKQASASIPTSWLTSSFRFKLVFSSTGKNNLYVDNINLDVNAGIIDQKENLLSINLFPNPADQILELQYNLDHSEKLQMQCLNIIGQEMFRKELEATQGTNATLLPTNNIGNGSYLITIRGKNFQKQLRFEIIHQ